MGAKSQVIDIGLARTAKKKARKEAKKRAKAEAKATARPIWKEMRRPNRRCVRATHPVERAPPTT